MKSKEECISFSSPIAESVVSRFCTVFLEAGWIAAAVLSALFMNVFTRRMFDPDQAALIRSIAILMFVAWLIKIIEHAILSRRNIRIEQPQGPRSRYGWIKYCIFLPAGLYFLSYLISTFTSVLPATSFWGSYKWAQGLYTTGAYFVIFILAATHLKSRVQVERLVSAIILTSLPVMAYGLIQKLGWDPVSWPTGPAKRIFSTMGNPIFYAAYLIMVVPLVLTRLLQSRHKVSGLGYSLVLLLQIVSIIFTQSRGPLLGLVSGLAFFFLIYAIIYKKKVLVWGLAGGLILGTIFVIIFNLPNTPLEPLKKVPYLERLGQLNPSEGTARARIIDWGNALKLMRETYQPILPHPELIDAHPWRFILGYGPETLRNIFYRYHSKELVDLEGQGVFVDNCHNSLLQVLVTQGVFGLIAFLCLISGTIYLGLKTLFTTGLNRINQINPVVSSSLLVLGIISAIVAHFVESFFGREIVVTYTHFWIFLALLYALGRPALIPSRRDKVSTGSSLTALTFWIYLGVSLVIFAVVVKQYKPGFDTNVRAWITGTYLWILLGLLLGTINLYFNAPQRANASGVSSAFNFIGYIGLITAAFFLIVYSNFNPILADGYHRISFSAKKGAEKIRRGYHQLDEVQRRLLEKKSRISLSPDEEKQLQSVTAQRRKMLSKMFGLHWGGIIYDQRALRLAPNEKTYLHGMGQNFLELATIWRDGMNEGWALKGRDMRGKWIEADPKAPGCLDGPPSIKEIMDFPAEQYYKPNQYDFFYCGLTVMKKAYEIEPTDYNQRLTMARVYRYGAKMARRAGRIKESEVYFQKATEYYQEAQEASPNHPDVNEDIKALLKEMQKVR